MIRRDWTAHTATIMKINGTPGVARPAVLLPAGVNDSPGTTHDQVLALVPVMNTARRVVGRA